MTRRASGSRDVPTISGRVETRRDGAPSRALYGTSFGSSHGNGSHSARGDVVTCAAGSPGSPAPTKTSGGRFRTSAPGRPSGRPARGSGALFAGGAVSASARAARDGQGVGWRSPGGPRWRRAGKVARLVRGGGRSNSQGPEVARGLPRFPRPHVEVHEARALGE